MFAVLPVKLGDWKHKPATVFLLKYIYSISRESEFIRNNRCQVKIKVSNTWFADQMVGQRAGTITMTIGAGARSKLSGSRILY